MSLRHAVLGLLSSASSSGYDLMKRFDRSLVNVWSATQSQLYTELTRMATDGLIEVSVEGARGRKEYSITDAGLAELRHWMTDVEPEPLRRNAMLLRIFFLDLLPRDEARAYLRRQGELAAERHAALVKIADEIEGDDSVTIHSRIALEWGLRANTMARDWAEWAEGALERGLAAGEVPAVVDRAADAGIQRRDGVG